MLNGYSDVDMATTGDEPKLQLPRLWLYLHNPW